MRRSLQLVILVCVLSGAASVHAIVIEAEDFVASHDEGGAAIYRVSCGAASGGKAVEGFDYPGDWIEVVITLGANGSFADTLRSAALTGVQSTVAATVFGCGPSGEDLVSVFNTVGRGIY